MRSPEPDAPGAVVIGAAGGIGSAVVNELWFRGMPVIGLDLQHAPGHEEPKGDYEHLVADASQAGSLSTLLDVVDGRDFRYVVNVAGGATPEEVEQSEVGVDRTLFQKTFRSNWETSVTAIEAARALARRRGGEPARASVTLCSSINSIGHFQYPVYSASKASVESLAATMCVPLADDGVRINVVRLGTVLTDASTSLHGHSADHYEPLAELSALRQFPTAEQVAKVIVAMASDFDCVTGTVLTADNGQSLPGLR